ncbi:MAG: hypothetical protein WC307_02585 [Candidatus Nanoarchaeia archaeon]
MIEYLILFLSLLAPNVMRQLVYLASYKKTKTFGFCVSPETRSMQSHKWLPWSGILEELGWGSAWTIAWALGYPWLAFGWVSDALLDCAIAYAWAQGKRKPKILFAGAKGAFFVREVLLPYLIIGPILFLLGLNIFVYCAVATIIGIVLLAKIK